MSIYGGPDIVSENLTLYLDAGNKKSYPGSGADWFDLAQGIVFSSIGTQTPHTTVNGAKCFSFNNNGYWRSDGSYHTLVDLAGDCTVLMWLYSEDVTGRRTIFQKNGTSYQSYEQEIAVTWEVAENFSYYSRRSNYDYGNTATMSQDRWHLIGLKMSSGKSATARSGYYSLNGSAWTGNYTSRSSSAITAASSIQVGSGYAGTCHTGKIACVMCYDKMLSNEEIKFNYNALKGRFGL